VTTNRPSAAGTTSATLLTIVVVVTVLYFAREVFIPLALAVLFSFLLAPLVVGLRRMGLPRVPSVLSVVTLAFVVIAFVGGLVAIQLSDLGHKLPEYQKNINEKLHSIRDSSNGVIGRLTRVVDNITRELNPPSPTQPGPSGEKPVPVEIRHASLSPMQVVPKILGSLLSVLMLAAVVVVFVIFMLMEREDLRDRFIRLMGSRQMDVTTKALDEAATRVSRYLRAQLLLNVSFAVPAGLGLYFIGVPNPVLWAVLAALLRYVPYLGIWLAATMPAAVAFAIDPGWFTPFAVFAIYFGIDIFMYNFVEPWVYGSSTGLTPLAILVAAVFWTWLWGPVGLLLATPLTVCLAVLGRYVPSLRFLGILLSDQPVLSPQKRLYQRLLAADVEEAIKVAEEFLKGKSLEELYDRVMVPALILVEQDRHADRLDEKQQEFIFRGLRMIVAETAEHAPEIIARETDSNGRSGADARGQQAELPDETAILSLPANDEADEIAALMLAQLLNLHGIAAKAVSADALASERLEDVARERVRVVAVTAVPPSGFAHARYLCKRLRVQLPEVKIVVALPGCGEAQEIRKREPSIPANEIATTLSQAVAEILPFVCAAPVRREHAALSS
jgi:predicted PurR-regulated permease PerM